MGERIEEMNPWGGNGNGKEKGKGGGRNPGRVTTCDSLHGFGGAGGCADGEGEEDWGILGETRVPPL
jgi:hypothetical protein